MGRMSSLEKGGELVAIIGKDLLGESKFEHVSEEARDAIDVFTQQEDVVEARWVHTLQVRRSWRRVDQREAIADLYLSVLEVDRVAAWTSESDDFTRSRVQLAGTEALGRDASSLDACREPIELVPLSHLERQAVQPVRGSFGQDQ